MAASLSGQLYDMYKRLSIGDRDGVDDMSVEDIQERYCNKHLVGYDSRGGHNNLGEHHSSQHNWLKTWQWL